MSDYRNPDYDYRNPEDPFRRDTKLDPDVGAAKCDVGLDRSGRVHCCHSGGGVRHGDTSRAEPTPRRMT
jgi:hypothetical protein